MFLHFLYLLKNHDIQLNVEDYNNGSLSYEELHALQHELIKERDELLQD